MKNKMSIVNFTALDTEKIVNDVLNWFKEYDILKIFIAPNYKGFIVEYDGISVTKWFVDFSNYDIYTLATKKKILDIF